MMRRIGRSSGSAILLKTLCFAAAFLLGEIVVFAQRNGDWPNFMRDGGLSGFSPLSEKIDKPEIIWRHFVGSRRSLLEISFSDQGSAPFIVPASDVALSDSDLETLHRQWGYGGPYYDLDQSGSYTRLTSNELQANYYKIGDFLPDVKGLEKIEWLHEVSDPVKLYERSDGQWQMRWKIESPVNTSAAANRNVIVDDLDGDGQLETAGIWWYKLMVADLRTGDVEQLVSFFNEGSFSGRAYGWLGSHDFDRDGKKELVILADTENHLDVLGWEGDKLTKLWGRIIESGIAQKKTIVVPGVNPLEDIDGDGTPEIVLSVYNYDYATNAIGGGKWHVVVLEPMTGNVRLDITDEYLSGLRDLDNDKIVELFTTSTTGEQVDDPGMLKIRSFRDGNLSIRWQPAEAATFQTQPIEDFPQHVNTSSPEGWRTTLAGPFRCGGRSVFFTNRIVNEAANLIRTTAWQTDEAGTVRSVGTLEAPNLEVLAVRAAAQPGEATVLARIEVFGDVQATVRGSHTSADVVYCERLGVEPISAVVGQLKDSQSATVVVEGATKTVEAFQPRAGGRAQTVWRKPGHSALNRPGSDADRSVALAELNGDGILETVFATRGPNGQARIVAVEPDGRELWHHDFEGIPWQEQQYVTPGMGGWFAGHFTSRDHDDLFVTVQRGTGHTGQEGYMLSGLDGGEIWHRTEGGSTPYGPFGVGGQWMVVYDYDNDGLDDILSNFPMTIYVMRGHDGRLLLDEFVQRLFGVDAYNGFMAAGEYRRSGQLDLFYGVMPVGFSLLDRSGELIWNNADAISPARPAAGDIDGDGRIEFVQIGTGALRAIDSSSGQIEWTLQGLGGYAPPVLVDVTGDEIPEALITSGSKLTAVTCGRSQNGRILWEVQLPDIIGTPAIGEINKRLQVVCSCKDGFVYGIGARD